MLSKNIMHRDIKP